MQLKSSAKRAVLCFLALVASDVRGLADDVGVPFRTDSAHQNLPWFQLRPAEFPPEGSAHYIAGELIGLDHVNRTGVLRLDRTDAQRRGDWDLPHHFVMLPFGMLRYHGAPAELRDIPLGTHLHGYFYLEPPSAESKPKPAGPPVRISIEAPFS